MKHSCLHPQFFKPAYSLFGLLSRFTPACRTGRLCLAVSAGLTLPAWSLAADDAPSSEPLPNPLNRPPEPTPSRGGYFGGGDPSLPLQPPARLQIGDFALQSSASFFTSYDDNIEADDEERDEDVFFSFAPSIRAQSLYARHSIGFGASGTASTALKNGSEDFFDWRIGADGKVDLSRQSKITAAVGYTRDTEDDEAIDAEEDQDDLAINLFNASLNYNVNGDTIGYSLGSSISRLDAEGSDFDDRDRTTLGLRASASYAFSDRLSLSLGPSYQYSTFDEEVADDGEGRDAQIIGARIGGGYKVSRTINTQASLGYSIARFADGDRKEDQSAVGDIGVIWDAGAGTSLELRAGQTLGLTVVDGADSRKTTTGSARLNHRLQLGSRSVLSSSLSYRIAEISDLDRTDHNIGASLGYAYRLAENIFFSSSYRFSRRDSEDNEADYYRNLISLGISVTY